MHWALGGGVPKPPLLSITRLPSPPPPFPPDINDICIVSSTELPKRSTPFFPNVDVGGRLFLIILCLMSGDSPGLRLLDSVTIDVG